ncbi:MAG: hypothetical protein HYV95_01725 [Opitutae bacterium]|nr:hypothetical protein [Opitutae bacterium]
MSSTESSGAAPAEATATTPAGATAAAPTFGSSRGSGLARGKRSTTSGPATSTAAAPTGYTPTAIEIVTAPREYQNPFAPAETPAAATPEPTAPAAPAPVAPIEQVAPVQNAAPVATPAPRELFPLEESSAPAPAAAEEPAELNILPPERQKTTPAQTWESEGFRPARESRGERPRREEPAESNEPAAEVDIASIPPQFLYVRPGVKFVPTPRNWGGAPRERGPKSESAPATARTTTAAPAAAKSSGGFLGWLKGLFGGTPEAQPAETRNGEHRSDHGERGGHRRHRGGRGHGESSGHSHGGEHREGGRRRRGGRGRGPRGEGGSSAT